MKGLLLTGSLIFGSLFGNDNQSALQLQNLESYLEQLQQQVLNDMNSLRQTSDQNNYAITNEQLNQIVRDLNQMYGDGVRQKLKHHRLPAPRSRQAQQTGLIKVSAGDGLVDSTILDQTVQTIETISMPILQESVGNPSKAINVVLYSSSKSYAKALSDAGMSRGDVQKFIKGTQGLTVDNEVWIPLYNLDDSSEIANVMTHELTHAILNQKGIGDTIPVWVNEGIAWHNGMIAKGKVSPTETKQLESMLNQQVQDVASSGQLLPLTASEDDIVSASYTVEWVDYLAVEQLIEQKGLDYFLSFLDHIQQDGVDQAFSTIYDEPISTFESDFYNHMNQ